MTFLILKAWFALAWYDLTAKVRGYRAVQVATQREVSPPHASLTRVSWERICEAIEIASVLYFKQVHCLQRSSTATRLLRNAGWDAHLVVGVQMTPFISHAWVELDGAVVNDKPYMRQKYRVLGQAGEGRP
jgi:hypothetical protein